MELAFWDPNAVGDFAPDINNLPENNGPKGTTNDVMQTMGSLAFDEMLEWMEQDLGNSEQLLNPELAGDHHGGTSEVANGAFGSNLLPAGSTDFQSFLDSLTGGVTHLNPVGHTAELAALGGGNPPPPRVPLGSESPVPSTSMAQAYMQPLSQQGMSNMGLPAQPSPMFNNMQQPQQMIPPHFQQSQPQQHTNQMGAGQPPQHTHQMGGGQPPQHVQQMGAGQPPQYTHRMGAGQPPQHMQQMGPGQPPRHTQQMDSGQPPQQSHGMSAGQAPQQNFMGMLAMASMMQGMLPSPFQQGQMSNGNGMQRNTVQQPIMSPFQQQPQQAPLGLGMMGPGLQLPQNPSPSHSGDLLRPAPGPVHDNHPAGPKPQREMVDLIKLEQQVTAELTGAKDPVRDVLTQTLLEHSVGGINQGQSSLYAQNMARQFNRSRIQVGPKEKGGRPKNKLNELEKRVAELQMQKSQLTEETTNLQCRLNILDRMLQLRREGADEVLEQNVRLDEQIQVAALSADTREAAKNPMAEPPVIRTIPKILMQDYSIPTFEEMSNFFKLSVERVSSILTEMDRLPRGTIVLETPLAATLQKELQAAQSFLMGYQAKGGGYLIQNWQLKVYEQMLTMKPTEPAEFEKRYKQVYPLLQLSQQQKERIKLSYDIYTKRMKLIGEEQKRQEEKTRELLLNGNHLSMTERCREMMRAHQSLWRLRCIHENLKEGHSMFVSIVMQKILDTMQLARLMISSYPFLPCTIKLAETVDADLRATTGVISTELAAQEMMAIVKPYASKFARQL